MAKADYRILSDGHLGRDAPLWTEEKLMILEAYLPAFANVTKHWHGLDLFAGYGLNWSLTREAEIPGSPLAMLQAEPPADEVQLCEMDRRAVAALGARTAQYGDRARIYYGEANGTAINQMLPRVPVRAPTFAFSDPEGADLAWHTVEALAAHKRGHSNTRIEQLILFPTDMGFMRLLDHKQRNEDGASRVNRIMPGDEWRDVWDARARGEISADEARTEYVRSYADGLRQRLGYRTVLDREVPAVGRRQYFLIFATDDDKGERIMDHCFDQVRARTVDELAQPQLFPVKQQPRRKRA
jgi:three-Cys-motif partner protein